MKIQLGDTVMDDSSKVGIIEQRQGDTLIVRFPDAENKRERISRKHVHALAEVIYEERKQGKECWNKLSLTGKSTLAELVWEFGYPNQRLRSETLDKVYRQFQRAGLELKTENDRWNRDDKFKLDLTTYISLVIPETNNVTGTLSSTQLLPVPVSLPELFWPTTLGLDPNRELAFLRALTGPDPILCLLHVPDDPEMHSWLQATWDGLVSWAFHAAQRFCRSKGDFSTP